MLTNAPDMVVFLVVQFLERTDELLHDALVEHADLRSECYSRLNSRPESENHTSLLGAVSKLSRGHNSNLNWTRIKIASRFLQTLVETEDKIDHLDAMRNSMTCDHLPSVKVVLQVLRGERPWATKSWGEWHYYPKLDDGYEFS